MTDDPTRPTPAHDTLEHSASFLEAIIENIPHMIFVKDAQELRFVRFNKAGEELLGIPRTQMYGKNDYDFFPAEEADFFTAKDRAVLASGELHGPEEYPGTGIGLALCRKIAERHRGSIAVESDVDAGATFVVRLPLSHTQG